MRHRIARVITVLLLASGALGNSLNKDEFSIKDRKSDENMTEAYNMFAEMDNKKEDLHIKRYNEDGFEYIHGNFGLGAENKVREYAKRIDYEYVGKIGELEDWYALRKRAIPQGLKKREYSEKDIAEEHQKIRELGENVYGGKDISRVNKRRLFKRAVVTVPASEQKEEGKSDKKVNWEDKVKITDPFFGKQWHLLNTDRPGTDINVTGVWAEGVTGRGVTVALIDDGLDYTNEDLFLNFDLKGSYDFNDSTKLPTPRLSDDYHGTRCAGQIAAVRNNVCGVGAAYDAKVSGIRMLSGQVSEMVETQAINYKFQHNDIYSCSWGPSDDGATVQGPEPVMLAGFMNGINKGRQGRGSIYIFATGNGGVYGDNCNFDGYTNSIYTISIGAIDDADKHPSYSEQCSAHLAVTYSSGTSRRISTSDIGVRGCTSGHGGTSAAAPLAAGIVALALSVRPDLSWRDVQQLMVETAVPVDLEDPDWQTVAGGKLKFNHKYGFGKLDAYRMVDRAKYFQNLGPQVSITTGVIAVNQQIPEKSSASDGSGVLVSKIKFTKEQVMSGDIGSVEHVTVKCNMQHNYRGSVQLILEGPNGVRSLIAPSRKMDSSRDGLKNWSFTSVKHWGTTKEDLIDGEWKLLISNEISKDSKDGVFIDWELTVFGVSASIKGPAPQPPKFNEERDDGSSPEPSDEDGSSIFNQLPDKPVDKSSPIVSENKGPIKGETVQLKKSLSSSASLVLVVIILFLMFMTALLLYKLHNLNQSNKRYKLLMDQSTMMSSEYENNLDGQGGAGGRQVIYGGDNDDDDESVDYGDDTFEYGFINDDSITTGNGEANEDKDDMIELQKI
ncbi:Protease KEX1 [Zancudomyces culisetae]|uniref:Protease KEX1 n=1 Tax=Zancudomyces culisetae TaxID=1213189 RepID=A0A1R1PQL6_ZANCU|nr:Protease KEX1 [Zancudomyces culisetae]OMH84363.1 Protease KEX1 [Zancudomyces culisetae]|eukprot:OMH83239.1 Protease KEX1 [Zancudomyces culisetae]